MAKAVGLEERLASADLCLTGEGRIDGQSANGKVCYHVAQLAKKHNIPVIAIAGSVGVDADKNVPPLTAFFAIVNQPMELSQAVAHAPELIQTQAEQIARIITTFRTE